MYAPNHPVSKDVVEAREVRVIEIEEHVEAIITVKTKFHVELIFDSVVIDIFEKDGVVYTRQQARTQDVKSVGSWETDGEADEYQTPDDPIDVTRAAGGNFAQVNEKHAHRLEIGSLTEVMKELQWDETQLDGEFGEGFTQN